MRKAVLDLHKWSAEDINNLPDMQVDGEVWLPDLKENNEIERIPILGLKVGGSLNLSGCKSLTSLPEGLKVEGSLNLRYCEKLKSLPEGLEVGGILYLNGCKSLTSLPEGLKVEGYLSLIGCELLTSLPKGLEVGGSLYLDGCESLTSLPQDLQVEGKIYYNSDTGFAKIEGFMDKPEIIPPHLRGKFSKFRY